MGRYGELLSTVGGKERLRRFFHETEWPVPGPERNAFINNLHQRKTDLFVEICGQGDLAPRPGIIRLVDEAIEEGIKLAVCSTADERAVKAVVDALLGPARSASGACRRHGLHRHVIGLYVGGRFHRRRLGCFLPWK